jgi:hypothetical protein
MNDENTIINGDENAGPTGETQTAQPAFPASRSRNGKIARLPLAIRQQLNQRLQNGEWGKLLVEWLTSLPEVQAIMAVSIPPNTAFKKIKIMLRLQKKQILPIKRSQSRSRSICGELTLGLGQPYSAKGLL